ncbi:hypothetical protein AAF712_015132 [Marasmius tenuissimus]|uniref:Uncharacterized protein n=1 Tax=Marasmius tenuissimus TaxID=585030 RepID=A0ABR2ZB77_9AGAR
MSGHGSDRKIRWKVWAFGPLAESYFPLHGYDDATAEALKLFFRDADGDQSGFFKRVQGECPSIPESEIAYMWDIGTSFKPTYPPEDDSLAQSTARDDEDEQKQRRVAQNRNRIEIFPTDAVAVQDELKRMDQDGWEQCLWYHAALQAGREEDEARRQRKSDGRQDIELEEEEGQIDGTSDSGLETVELVSEKDRK